ncbi:MAG: hypothetical protein RIB53_00920 [Roseitalea porphyridii]|jgi:hypothetical protein|uniref:hypothetical protein n=1 Tax=Roseitalea porphyridii TaxID=1852022 RepID=UPI0032EBD627
MNALTISQTESIPNDYPAVTGLSSAALGVDQNALWQRIEGYVAHRWTARNVEWIVEGPGEWKPLLIPAAVNQTDVWRNDEWQSVTLKAAPLGGYRLPAGGPYRIVASVGAGPVAAAVLEAYRRLAEWTADAENARITWASHAGAKRAAMNVDGVSLTMSRDPNFAAHAMQMSGAADLLRSYRIP